MINVWCVRANGGQFTEHFLRGGYAAIGWGEIDRDLSDVRSRDDLYPIVRSAYPEVQSAVVIGNFVGQIARFLLEMQAQDYIITPAQDTEILHYGQVAPDPSYFYATADDGCRYRHRRRVTWEKTHLRRRDLSVPLQNTLRSSLSVFAISQREEFLAAIGRAPKPPPAQYDPHRLVLERLLQLDAKEFEILIGHLLAALGFVDPEVTGKPGDGGVDVTGDLDVAGLAKVEVYVQVKRYKLGSKINANTVRQLRQAIPFGGQGAFITTADFQSAAADIAMEAGFPCIGLINGHQLVDLLVEHWTDIPQEFRDRLGLKPGLVPA